MSTVWWTLVHWRLKSVWEFGAPQLISTGLASWQRYCTALQYWASAKLCGVEHRAPPIFGRAAITLGIGPHSSNSLCRWKKSLHDPNCIKNRINIESEITHLLLEIVLEIPQPYLSMNMWHIRYRSARLHVGLLWHWFLQRDAMLARSPYGLLSVMLWYCEFLWSHVRSLSEYSWIFLAGRNLHTKAYSDTQAESYETCNSIDDALGISKLHGAMTRCIFQLPYATTSYRAYATQRKRAKNRRACLSPSFVRQFYVESGCLAGHWQNNIELFCCLPILVRFAV